MAAAAADNHKCVMDNAVGLIIAIEISSPPDIGPGAYHACANRLPTAPDALSADTYTTD
jgi:hypothetical protein